MSLVGGTSWKTACLAAIALVALGAPPGHGVALRAQVPSAPPPAVSPQLPSFRTGVDIVSLSVTVTNPAGRFVTDLTPGQFGVFEDGAKQDVAFFNRTNLPIALALLLDTSASMEEQMATAQEAAVGFARRLRPQDLGELIDFDREVKVLQGFTHDQAALENAILKTTAGGSTSLYNAVYISLKELKKVRAATEQDVRRHAIVVVSDGEDTSSLVTYDQVLDLAKRSETAIYAIGLRSKDEIVDKRFKEADFVLRQLAQETGGRVFFPARIEDLAGVYAQIADELASQYILGYISKNPARDGAWRRIAVRVDREGVTARSKLGYFGPTGKTQ
ncbi:MAG TPA: VWA domain-containing protein [Vicinamibacterales bacterium]